MSNDPLRPPSGSDRPGEPVLANDAFDELIAPLDGPAQVVPELVDLFRQPRIDSSLAHLSEPVDP